MTALIGFLSALWSATLKAGTWFLSTFGLAGALVAGLVIFYEFPSIGRVDRAAKEAATEARKDLVSAADKASLEAQVWALDHQLQIANSAAASYRASAEKARKEADDAKAKLDAAIAADTGADGAVVGPDDLDWLSKH